MKKICYLLESADLYGGVRIVFDQALALKKLGYNVIILAKTGNHSWYPRHLPIEYTKDFSSFFHNQKPDVVIATFWTTIVSAQKINAKITLHLCQGYEGDIIEYKSIINDITQVYKLSIPKLTVSPWLSDYLSKIYPQQFKIFTIGQIVDTHFFYPTFYSFIKKIIRRLLNKPLKILVVGSFSSKIKGIEDALTAIEIARKKQSITLIRVSTEPQNPRENEYTHINFYLQKLPPIEMAKLYRSVDLLIMPSHQGEGFGLPLAEAMACGTPCIATKISAFLDFDTRKNYAYFVNQQSPQEISTAIAALSNLNINYMRLSFRGITLIRKKFTSFKVAKKIAAIIESNNL